MVAKFNEKPLLALTGCPDISVAPLDLADLRSVKAFADAWHGPLHILVNNAGIMAVPDRQETAQGFELQFGTNFLGRFALTFWLHEALATGNGAGVVSVCSSGHTYSPVIFDDLYFNSVPCTPFGAYGQSKTAVALMSVGITQQWSADGITSNALNPGAIVTGLQKYTGGLKTPVGRRKTVEQGAATSVLLAAPPCWKASAAVTSRAATKRRKSIVAQSISAAEWLHTRSTRPMRCVSGTFLGS